MNGNLTFLRRIRHILFFIVGMSFTVITLYAPLNAITVASCIIGLIACMALYEEQK